MHYDGYEDYEMMPRHAIDTIQVVKTLLLFLLSSAFSYLFVLSIMSRTIIDNFD